MAAIERPSQKASRSDGADLRPARVREGRGRRGRVVER